jgi:hypothetical protein
MLLLPIVLATSRCLKRKVALEECAVGVVDACANVKFLARIELSEHPGRDTRPTSKASHEEHHTKEGHEHLKHD